LNHEDTEECVNDSYLSVWDRIPPEKPNPLLAFVLKIVRNIALNRLKFNTREKRNNTHTVCLEELKWCVSSNETVESEIELKYVSSCIDEYLKHISKTNRIIFVRRYWFMDSFKEISAITGLSEGAIRTRLTRTRDGLRIFLKERGIIE
jgi:RNA polymerase sigma-70 factor (ECF subfamily)